MTGGVSARGRGARGNDGRGGGANANGGGTGLGVGLWNLMFGADADRSRVAAEEEPITQNTPEGNEWDDDFLYM